MFIFPNLLLNDIINSKVFWELLLRITINYYAEMYNLLFYCIFCNHQKHKNKRGKTIQCSNVKTKIQYKPDKVSKMHSMGFFYNKQFSTFNLSDGITKSFFNSDISKNVC